MPRQSSLLRYSGGKSLAADFILSRFPKTQIDRYIEPFAGGFTVGLAAIKQDKALNYWLNDFDRGVYAFHWCVKYMPDSFCQRLREIKYKLELLDTHKQCFQACKKHLRSIKSPTLLDLGVWFYIANKCSWSGTGMYGGYSKSAAHDRFTLSSIDRIGKIAPLYKDLSITDWDYVDLLKVSQSIMNDKWLVYLDPPYTEATYLYKGHKDFNHEVLAYRLYDCKSNVLISYDDTPLVREMYNSSKWIIEEVELVYSMNKKKKGKELLIRNYEI